MDNCYLGWYWNFETKEFERWRGKKNFSKPPAVDKDD
tara:strand:- start:125 stop:235 length:111 start_codon:yes stop_codon:yes gene_type:complete